MSTMNAQQLTIKWANDCRGQNSADCIGAAFNIIQSVCNYATPEYRAQVIAFMQQAANQMADRDIAPSGDPQ